MNWKTCLQIALLIIFIAIVFYIVCPKYYFYYSKDEEGVLKGNRVTGKLEAFTSQTGQWVTLRNKPKE